MRAAGAAPKAPEVVLNVDFIDLQAKVCADLVCCVGLLHRGP